MAVARIVAAFYPKFENESADGEVRGEMERLVGNGVGVLEVSVKHSGSLFLWAGARRGAYAKNSFGNEYSAVGVWVLGETLRNAWGEGVVRQKQRELSDYLEGVVRQKQREVSDYLEVSHSLHWAGVMAEPVTEAATRNRMAVGMELVTSVLGNHFAGRDRRKPMRQQPLTRVPLPPLCTHTHTWQRHRMAVGMELVTSVLGNHGQRPLQAYAPTTPHSRSPPSPMHTHTHLAAPSHGGGHGAGHISAGESRAETAASLCANNPSLAFPSLPYAHTHTLGSAIAWRDRCKPMRQQPLTRFPLPPLCTHTHTAAPSHGCRHGAGHISAGGSRAETAPSLCANNPSLAFPSLPYAHTHTRQHHRMAVGMELVTSVLGDHGQRPLQDYVVVTAVTDMASHPPRFLSTPEVLRFCHTWRLPFNSYWLFHSSYAPPSSLQRRSCSQLFAAYSALSEEGTAHSVEETLTGIADVTIAGTASHGKLQGNIMEGLVARLVSPRSLQQVRELKAEMLAGPAPSYPVGAGTRLRDLFSQHDSMRE
ncbi:unnamed protein product, partial [Closterium sp. Naga37s-1]